MIHEAKKKKTEVDVSLSVSKSQNRLHSSENFNILDWLYHKNEIHFNRTRQKNKKTKKKTGSNTNRTMMMMTTTTEYSELHLLNFLRLKVRLNKSEILREKTTKEGEKNQKKKKLFIEFRRFFFLFLILCFHAQTHAPRITTTSYHHICKSLL